ncbi:MAG TPA: hypothetical protein VMT99_02345 [Candidatus Paceibacterota bacterium]|nr:hypothetical protein [Candidatus Paceibacterota bacterium]
MKKVLAIVAVVIGIGCLWAAYVYWTTPADALPGYFPGFDPAMAGIHMKHGLAALIVGLALFVFAWFSTGKKQASR